MHLVSGNGRTIFEDIFRPRALSILILSNQRPISSSRVQRIRVIAYIVVSPETFLSALGEKKKNDNNNGRTVPDLAEKPLQLIQFSEVDRLRFRRSGAEIRNQTCAFSFSSFSGCCCCCCCCYCCCRWRCFLRCSNRPTWSCCNGCRRLHRRLRHHRRHRVPPDLQQQHIECGPKRETNIELVRIIIIIIDPTASSAY